MERSKKVVKVKTDVLKRQGMIIKRDKLGYRRCEVIAEDGDSYFLQVGKKVKSIVVPKSEVEIVHTTASKRQLMENSLKRCPRCEKIKKLSEFTKSKAKADSASTYCRKCESELRKRPEAKQRQYARHKEWRQKNHDKWVGWSKRYAREHKKEIEIKRKKRWKEIGRDKARRKRWENPTPTMLKNKERIELRRDGLKRCPKCNKIKNLESDFYNNPSNTSKDGKSTYCKKCTNERYYQWFKANKERFRDRINRYQRERIARRRAENPTKRQQRADMQAELLKKGLKNCSICSKTKPISGFWKAKNPSIDGLAPHCIECGRKRNKEYRRKDRQRRKRMGRPKGSKTKKVHLTKQQARWRITKILNKLESDRSCASYRSTLVKGLSDEQKIGYRKGMQKALVMARDYNKEFLNFLDSLDD